MARVRLNKKFVDELPAPAKGQAFVWDIDLPGFGVRTTPTGAKAWVVQFRVRGGKERRMVVGLCSKTPLEKARAAARTILSNADLGRDPAEERRDARDLKPEANPLFAEFAERWMVEVAGRRNRAGTLKHRRLLLKNHILPRLGGVQLLDLTRRAIEEMHHEASKEYPIAANRAVSLCSAMFASAVRWGMRVDNPAADIERNSEAGRERYLTADELSRLQLALDASPAQDSADAVRMLILTGARVGEVLSMRWDQADLALGVWSKPAATTKQNKLHRVPLSPPAVALLQKRQAAQKGSPWVFPGRERPDSHMTTIRTFWAAVCRRAGIAEVRVHDLRHTFASMLVSAGESLPVVGALLGHTQAKTTSRYAHLLDDPLRRAAARMGEIAYGGKI